MTTENQIADPQTLPAAVRQPLWSDSNAVANIQRVAKMFASSPLVPQTYQGERGLGSCVIALNMADRMGADPLMVMQNLYVVHGRPSWSAQFLIACFNQTGRFDPIRYRFVGKQGTDDWGCRAYTKDLSTGEEIEGPLITIALSKAEGWYNKNGSKWKTIPELMLRYRSAAWLVRTIAPEIAMGLPTAEESHDINASEKRVVKQQVSSEIDELESDDEPEVIDAEVVDNGPDPDEAAFAEEMRQEF